MRSTWKIVASCALVVIGSMWLILPSSSCGATPVGAANTPSADGGSVEVEGSSTTVETGDLQAAAQDVPADTPQLEVSAEPPAVPPEVKPEEPAVPETLAEKYLKAGGLDLCVAMVYALNPDWRMDSCRNVAPERKQACQDSLKPLVTYANEVCKTVISESQRLDFDPVMVLAVIERESSFGRAAWDQAQRAFEINTDVCQMTLAKSRIVDRRPGRKPGIEVLTWTYGDNAPEAGGIARNRQPVRVVREDDTHITVNTCAAGEGGIMQTTPRELHTAGDLIGLTGSTAERRRAVDADPALQVRVGCQALAEHRDLAPESDRAKFWMYLGTYNTGSTTHGTQWCVYTRKVMREYLRACGGWIDTTGDLAHIQDVEDLWPECAEVDRVYRSGWDFCPNVD